MRAVLVCLCLAAFGAPASAQSVSGELTGSERPTPRPIGAVEAPARQPGLGARIAAALGANPKQDAQGRVLRSARPTPRPAVVRRVAAPRVSGAICNSNSIEGRRIAPISGRGACGVDQPVAVTAVAGVKLSTPAQINCRTARALETWVEKGAKPAAAGYGGGLTELHVVASYACRTRNSQSGARLSEHAKGNAIDIAGFRFANGSTVSLLQDWNKRREGEMLRQMWRAACGPFGTVLGPNSDRFHRDHFHFDSARRNRAFCR